MVLLLGLVFVVLAGAALTADLPWGERLLGAYLFLSLGAAVTLLSGWGLRLLREERSPRVHRPWVSWVLLAWAGGWVVAAAYVALDASVTSSLGSRIALTAAAVAFAAGLLVLRSRRVDG